MKKMVNCKTCNAQISPRAKRCPYCGEMTTNEKIVQILLGILFAPFILFRVVFLLSVTVAKIKKGGSFPCETPPFF